MSGNEDELFSTESQIDKRAACSGKHLPQESTMSQLVTDTYHVQDSAMIDYSPQQAKQPQIVATLDRVDIVYREKGRPESKTGSKRNSLDNKTVQVIN